MKSKMKRMRTKKKADTFYCKQTGEEAIEVEHGKNEIGIKCLVHGWHPPEHFENITLNKACAVCGRAYYCKDELRKVCSMECAREYSKK